MEEKKLTEQVETTNNEQKEYKEERFEFALFVNNNLVCKRNFKMYNFIEGSMQTMDFHNAMNDIVTMIDDDLKSKSRVYTWYFFDEENPSEEFVENPIGEWECVFKFAIYDNGREVYARVWDGRCYPAAIRNNVDIANNIVKIITKSGEVLTFDKDTYFEENKDRLSPDMYVKRAMIGDKQNLLPIITKRICEACSPWNNSQYSKISDYHSSITFGNGENEKEYNLLVEQEYRRYVRGWERATEEKTRAYFNRKR